MKNVNALNQYTSISNFVSFAPSCEIHPHYDAFGNTIAKGGDMVDVLHFWFSTKYLDHDTGLYYYGYRYYSSLLQRWINRDPIEEEGGVNTYQTMFNDMFNNVDFLGMWAATEDSKGQKRRKYISSCGDTIEMLAKQIKLSHQQYRMWLKSEDGQALPKTSSEKMSKANRVFSVPNTGYLNVSTYTWGFLASYLKGVSSGLQERWGKEGLKVVYNEGATVTVSSIGSHLGSNDIYKFAYIGHGAAGQFTKINDIRQFRPEEEYGLKSIFTAGKYTRYGIAEMQLHACESGAEIVRWKANVSILGVLLVLKGDELFQIWDAFQKESFVLTHGSSE